MSRHDECPVCMGDFDSCTHSQADLEGHKAKVKQIKILSDLVRRIVKEELNKRENTKSLLPPSFC